MFKKKLFLPISMLTLGILLTSCGAADIIKVYPDGAEDKIVDVEDIYGNNFQNYYDKLIKSEKTASVAFELTLNAIAKKNVTIPEAELSEQREKRLLEDAKSGKYDLDGEFVELDYVMSLRSSLYSITCGTDDALLDGKKNVLITPTTKYSAVFSCNYQDYFEKYLDYEIYKEKLVAKYLLDEDYKAIGNTNARQVKIIKIKDRDDKPGLAAKTINSFVEQIIKPSAPSDTLPTSDLDNLANIWKGTYEANSKEETFVKANSLETKMNQISEEFVKITDDVTTTDKALESKYTNGYTYSKDKGKLLAENSLKKEDIVIDDTFLKSDGLTDLPDALRKRIFSSNYNLSSSDKKDITTTYNGKKYLIPSTSESANDGDIVNYDASSKTYFIVEIIDVITPAVLEKKDDDSEEVKTKKAAQAAKVAKVMSAKSSYATDSIVHYFKKYEISYHDQAVYDYIKNKYGDIFVEDEEDDV